MTFFEWVRFLLGAALLLGGLFVMVTAVIGNYRFRNVLCRMHAAGLGDTLGIVLVFAGITVLCGISVFTLKLAAIVVLLWISSPVASHMIMRMEIENGSSADGKKEGKRK